MSTLVCFHAHPDDEALSTGGTIARAAAEGHRVVLVVATNGDYGEMPKDLEPDETLVDRRKKETAASVAALGISRVVWLGYKDSGMTGWEQNADPQSFLQAPLEEAAGRLASVLTEESADALTVYDWHGNYGHPDHIKVHTVGHRAAELAATPRVLEATINRDHFRKMAAMARESGQRLGDGDESDFDPDAPADDGNPIGTPEAEITLTVDAAVYAMAKRASLGAHRSQVTDTSFFLTMPEDAFVISFGSEWFIEKGVPTGSGPRLGWIFD